MLTKTSAKWKIKQLNKYKQLQIWNVSVNRKSFTSVCVCSPLCVKHNQVFIFHSIVCAQNIAAKITNIPSAQQSHDEIHSLIYSGIARFPFPISLKLCNNYSVSMGKPPEKTNCFPNSLSVGVSASSLITDTNYNLFIILMWSRWNLTKMLKHLPGKGAMWFCWKINSIAEHMSAGSGTWSM